jgi:hypothetical protein
VTRSPSAMTGEFWKKEKTKMKRMEKHDPFPLSIGNQCQKARFLVVFLLEHLSHTLLPFDLVTLSVSLFVNLQLSGASSVLLHCLVHLPPSPACLDVLCLWAPQNYHRGPKDTFSSEA